MTPPHPLGHEMSVKCEEPLDELTVQVWLLYLHPNFNYWTLFISGTELRTDRRTDGQTDGQTDGRTDGRSKHYMPPADLSGRGHKKAKRDQRTDRRTTDQVIPKVALCTAGATNIYLVSIYMYQARTIVCVYVRSTYSAPLATHKPERFIIWF